MSIKYVLGNDPGKIKFLSGDQDCWCVEVDSAGVDKIKAYIEDGDVVWFAIYRNRKEQVSERINSRYVETVSYFEE